MEVIFEQLFMGSGGLYENKNQDRKQNLIWMCLFTNIFNL